MRSATAAVLCVLFITSVCHASNTVNAQRVIEDFDFAHVDDLLKLDQMNVKMVIFKQRNEAAISSAHLAVFKKWIENGGIGYICEDAVLGSLFDKLNLAEYKIKMVRKESGQYFHCSEGVGELFVKNVVPSVEIHDHDITKGVEMLYVAGPKMSICKKNDYELVYVFTPMPSVKITPILSIGYTSERDDIYINSSDKDMTDIVTLFGVFESGRGLIVLDGTGLMTGNNHLDGNKYGWPTMYKNLLNYSR